MKKIFLLLIVATVFIGCNSREESGNRNNGFILKWVGSDNTTPKEGTMMKVIGVRGSFVYVGPAK